MAADRYKLFNFSYSIYFNFIILVCVSQCFSQPSNHERLRYTRANGATPNQWVQLVSLEGDVLDSTSIRERRYVDSAIPSLADNYNKHDVVGSIHDKDLISPVTWDIRNDRRMEMIGNLAVPVDSFRRGRDQTANADESVKRTSISNSETDHSKTHEATTAGVELPPASPTPLSTEQALPSKEPPKPDKTIKKPIDPNAAKKQVEIVKSTETPSTSASSTTVVLNEDFPQDVKNASEKHHLKLKEDHYAFYNSTFFISSDIVKQYWVEMDKEPGAIVNEMLSKSHRRAVTVQLSFDFPFYGYPVKNMTIATGGFLYTGDYIHSWLAATQYIAPLMANFDTGISTSSKIKYKDNGTAFTVEWNQVSLQDNKELGEFTFQVTLYNTGDIVFVYKDLPTLLKHIEDNQHPVKVGLSDAYIIDKTVFLVRRKTIYEYHRVNFNRQDIKNWTVIYFTALPTCHGAKTCVECTTAELNFECKWCDAVKRCSTGFDRLRQEWQTHSCDSDGVSTEKVCHGLPSVKGSPPSGHASVSDAPLSQAAISNHADHGESHGHPESGHSTGMVGIVLAIALVSGMALWVFYAYKNPHTRSGQVLIKYRPTQWGNWRRGEARYTAATIHM